MERERKQGDRSQEEREERDAKEREERQRETGKESGWLKKKKSIYTPTEGLIWHGGGGGIVQDVNN